MNRLNDERSEPREIRLKIQEQSCRETRQAMHTT
jgi:hypothetical protein